MMQEFQVDGWSEAFSDDIKTVYYARRAFSQIGFGNKVNTIEVPIVKQVINADNVNNEISSPSIVSDVKEGIKHAFEVRNNIAPMFRKPIKSLKAGKILYSDFLEGVFSLITLCKVHFEINFQDGDSWRGFLTFLVKYYYLTNFMRAILLRVENDK